MKSVLLALVLSLFTFNSNAQNKIGEITFDKDIIDYGNISTADSGVRTFTFTNTGDAPLTISKVKTSCGCTVPNYEKAAIMPGETGEIEVKYDTKRKGKFSKTLMVTSNASNKNVQLKIKGHITTDAVAINQ
ncbi:MAG: hypothetical protein BM564_08075 [Bacteroidetes bacterium MedPE-SWsnd-G2]|nr:MAG: hypothetical protein BM564_08075 [Bacteroidetes bacterium MedPE-SWsnd-G2]